MTQYTDISIQTTSDLKKYIRLSKVVYATIRLDVYDSWSKLSKLEAYFIADNLGDQTPKALEVEEFAHYRVETGELFIG